MLVHIYAVSVPTSPAIESHVRRRVAAAIRHVRDRVTRVEVHLRDDNGPKAGRDKGCTIEVRLNGQKPMAVVERDDDLYRAVSLATGKLRRAVQHKLGKLSRR